MTDDLKTQEMCEKAVWEGTCMLRFVPDRSKAGEMCNEAVEVDPRHLNHVPDHFKTQKN